MIRTLREQSITQLPSLEIQFILQVRFSQYETFKNTIFQHCVQSLTFNILFSRWLYSRSFLYFCNNRSSSKIPHLISKHGDYIRVERSRRKYSSKRESQRRLPVPLNLEYSASSQVAHLSVNRHFPRPKSSRVSTLRLARASTNSFKEPNFRRHS